MKKKVDEELPDKMCYKDGVLYMSAAERNLLTFAENLLTRIFEISYPSSMSNYAMSVTTQLHRIIYYSKIINGDKQLNDELIRVCDKINQKGWSDCRGGLT